MLRRLLCLFGIHRGEYVPYGRDGFRNIVGHAKSEVCRDCDSRRLYLHESGQSSLIVTPWFKGDTTRGSLTIASTVVH